MKKKKTMSKLHIKKFQYQSGNAAKDSCEL